MAAVGDGEIVTKFLLNTYRVQPTMHDVRAAVFSAGVACGHPLDEPETDLIPLISGSSAELYIKPMLSCVDDVDIMFHHSNVLAIPAGYPAPMQLPDEFRSRVTVFEIIDNEYPGYVYLKTRYLLQEIIDDGRFRAVMINKLWYLSHTRPADIDTRGPAATLKSKEGSPIPSVDKVYCVRCLSWPSQAADWSTRHRPYGCPDSATVDHVVSIGCDMVHVAHRLCRNNEWESKLQWRLSFSRAEIVLLNSWRPAQQIVYHMMRVFMKTERLTDVTDAAGTKIISNYHIKTLKLWACELKPDSWWDGNANVVTICVELLHTLAVWLADSRCPHYFIRSCNLMDTVTNPLSIADLLMSVTQSWLSAWFVNNYIQKCSHVCLSNVAWPFNYVSTSQKLQNAASAVVIYRRNSALDDLSVVYEHTQYLIPQNVTHWSERTDTYICIANDLAKLNLRLSHYLTAVAFLHIAIMYTNRDIDIESLDVLSTLCGQFLIRRRHSSSVSSATLLSQAVKLMKDVVNNSRSTVQLVAIELSKAYLYRTLRCKDSENDSMYRLANIYLAVLHYTTGQYQTAIDHCTLVTRSQDHSRCSSHVVQGDILPNIDAGVDNVLGVAVFYQHVRTAAFKQQSSRHVSVFSTDLFAHYMLVSCFPATECDQLARAISTNEDQHCYCRNVSDKQHVFVDDLLLFKSLTFSSKVRRHFQYQQRSTQTPADINTLKLVELLQQSAVEHLTIFRQFIAQEFDSVCTMVTTDIEAMYEFKRGDYQKCLQMSTQNVRALLYARRVTNVHTFPEFIQLLDDDIVSLTALTLIVDPKCRDVRSRYVRVSQLTLSLYLMTQCQLKLSHSATQLAQTLDCTENGQKRHTANCEHVLDRLTLKLAERLVLRSLYRMETFAAIA